MTWATGFRYVLRLVLILSGIAFALAAIHQIILPLASFCVPALRPFVYDIGVYGLYPTQDYISSYIQGPQASVKQWDSRCEGGLVLMTPNGGGVPRPGPMIVDSQGDLIWTSDEYGPTANLKFQQYKEQNYLTFWAGEKAATSGKGLYYMLDSTYSLVRTVSAVGDGLFGDLHEFKVTADGTALLTIYNTTTADLTGMGLGRGRDGWIVDNLFQEIDIETGELLFQWRASDHFNPIDTHFSNPFGGFRSSNPFDFYHINSVDKDPKGNYLISSRHFQHIVCISPVGETLWILGGDDNQFTDLSDGKATDFKWQHDARWVSSEQGILSLFDNQKAGALHVDAWHSRGMTVQLDLASRTVVLLQEFVSPSGILASSQGSVQILPNSSNVFVGWGSAAAFSEFSEDGSLLCEVHLGASWFFWWESMKSYRSTKVFDWHALPAEPPVAKIDHGYLYVTWNGATDVAYWNLEATVDDEEDGDNTGFAGDGVSSDLERDNLFETIDTIPKAGFEGVFELPADKQFTKFRVAAMDLDDLVLAYSEQVTKVDAPESSILVLMFKLFLLVGVIVGIRVCIKYSRSSGFSIRSWSLGKRGRLLSPAWSAVDRRPMERRSSERLMTYEWLTLKDMEMGPESDHDR